MKLGINTYTYMWSIGFKGPNPSFPDKEARPLQPLRAINLLEKAKSLGVSLLQTGPNLPLENLPEAELTTFIDTAHEWGISLELGTRGVDEFHLQRMVPLAKRMGARLIRTLPEIGGKYTTSPDPLVKEVCKSLPLLEAEGIKLGIENGKMPAKDMADAMEAIGSQQVGVVLDMVNSLAIPEGWKYVTEILAPYSVCVHYKDFNINRAWHMMGFICEGTPAGRGMVETEWLLDQLSVSQHNFNVIIELWPPEQANLEDTIAMEQAWAQESVLYLRRYITD
jgi:3-oxoisoapionate decarboxylase